MIEREIFEEAVPEIRTTAFRALNATRSFLERDLTDDEIRMTVQAVVDYYFGRGAALH